MKRALLKSARVLSATIVVMQKLARTLNAAEKPRKSIQAIPSLPHSSALVGRRMVAVEAIEGVAGIAAAERFNACVVSTG
jgi:hypothetical protein